MQNDPSPLDRPPTRRYRIVQLVHERIGSVGGIQRFDSRAISALSEIAHECDSELEVIAMHGGEFSSLPAHARIASAGGSRRKLLWLVLRAHLHGVDQMYIGHLRLAKLIWPVRLLFRKPRYVLFVHGVEAWSPGRTAFHRSITRWLLNRLVDDVVSVSRFTAARMQRAFQLERPRIHILPNALTIDAAIARPVASSVGASRRPVILTVSRMNRHDMAKGIPVALRAMLLLRNYFPTLLYRIVGDGELRADHENLARSLGLSEHVQFLGRVDEATLHQLYLSSDAFLLPSSKEGFGIVFLESWLHGLPIVCGNVDASTEVVDNGVDGFTVNPEDPSAIADALGKLLSQPELRQSFVERGREKIMQKYTAEQFLNTLRGIVQRPHLTHQENSQWSNPIAPADELGDTHTADRG